MNGEKFVLETKGTTCEINQGDFNIPHFWYLSSYKHMRTCTYKMSTYIPCLNPFTNPLNTPEYSRWSTSDISCLHNPTQLDQVSLPNLKDCSRAGHQSPTCTYLQWGEGGSIVTKCEDETEDYCYKAQ